MAWEGRGGWDQLIIVEDGPERTFLVPSEALHFSWREIQAALGENAWIISWRDSAIRCFGFLVAWWLNADYVLTLDDDCFPHPGHEHLFDRHIATLENTPRWSSTITGLGVRGLPYDNLGRRDDVVMSVGLWSGVPDLDGRTQLRQGIPPDFVPPPGKRLLPRGEYAPISGMNLCVARQALPLMYYPLMGEDSPYARFDDIWMGIVAKKLCDHQNWAVSVGEPFVRHVRASDPRRNQEREYPGVIRNETFWQEVDAICLSGHGIAEIAVMQFGQKLLVSASDNYMARLGRALQIWSHMFSKIPPGLKEFIP